MPSPTVCVIHLNGLLKDAVLNLASPSSHDHGRLSENVKDKDQLLSINDIMAYESDML